VGGCRLDVVPYVAALAFHVGCQVILEDEYRGPEAREEHRDENQKQAVDDEHAPILGEPCEHPKEGEHYQRNADHQTLHRKVWQVLVRQEGRGVVPPLEQRKDAEARDGDPHNLGVAYRQRQSKLCFVIGAG